MQMLLHHKKKKCPLVEVPFQLKLHDKLVHTNLTVSPKGIRIQPVIFMGGVKSVTLLQDD